MKSYHKQQLVFIAGCIFVGICMAILSILIVQQKLYVFHLDEELELTRFDVFNALFVGDKFDDYIYLGRDNIDLFSLPVTFSFVTIFISSYDFMTKPISYFSNYYQRVQNKKIAIKCMKGKGLYHMLFFVASYHLASYIGSYYTFVSCQIPSEFEIMNMFFVHMIQTVVMAYLFREISFILFCRLGVSKSFLITIVILLILFVLDVAIDVVNIFLYGADISSVIGIAFCLVVIVVLKCYENRIELPF